MTENHTNGVRITTKELWVEIQRQGRLLEKVVNSLPDTEDKVSDHEKRLRQLEQKIGWIFGALGLLGALVGVFSISLTP